MNTLQNTTETSEQRPPVLFFWRENKLKPEDPEEENETVAETSQSN